MDQIYEPNEEFPLNSLILTTPIVVSSGNFFIKYLLNDNPLYLQPPICSTKQGIIKGGKKMYCDLLFTNENDDFIRWIENLENYSQNYIYKNRESWFESDLEVHDIENSFISALKVYKSGKFYILRTIIPTHLGKSTLKLFDEKEINVDIDEIKDSTNVITILEFQGIRCSSRNFQIDIEIKQMMIIKPVKLFEKCIIKPKHQQVQDVIDDEIEDEIEEEEEIEKEEIKTSDKLIIYNDPSAIYEIDFDLANISNEETIKITERNDVYYKIYQEAINKAKQARTLAISTYLEAKNIKKLYMLDDIDDIDEMDIPDNET
jgi:hypothetical protein